jgi:hypothetical protein
LSGIDGLHIVVPVKQDRRLAGRIQPVGVDHWIPRRIHQPDVLHAGGAQRVGGPLRCAPDIASVFRQRADAGNGEKLFQLVDVAIAVNVDEINNSGVHGSIIVHAS